jgi:hypothetical protein
MANMKRNANSIKRIFPLSLIVFSDLAKSSSSPSPSHLLSRVLQQWLRPKLQPCADIMKTNFKSHLCDFGFSRQSLWAPLFSARLAESYQDCLRNLLPLSSGSLPWKRNVPPEIWYLCSRLYGVTFPKTVTVIFAAVITSNLIWRPSTMKMEAVGSSVTLVTVCQSTQTHISERSNN